MGMNTVIVMLNDLAHSWPKEMLDAMRRHGHEESRFAGGEVLSVSHADDRQIVSVHRNTGKRLSPFNEIDQADLDAMSELLRAHGYTVRRPGRQRGEGPLAWGYAAEQAKKATSDS
jgi:hypothetical protein